jgi:hypothetical protein
LEQILQEGKNTTGRNPQLGKIHPEEIPNWEQILNGKAG